MALDVETGVLTDEQPALPAGDGPAQPRADYTDDQTVQLEHEVELARLQGTVLRDIARQSPIRQVRFELGWRGTEWLDAADLLEQIGDEGTIELHSSLQRGMRVPNLLPDSGDDSWVRVVQMSATGYAVSVLDRTGWPKVSWSNVQGPSSPVVVRR